MPKNKKDNCVAVWAITPGGARLGEKIQCQLPCSCLYIIRKHAKRLSSPENVTLFDSLSDQIHAAFGLFKGHVFIFSTGIAVRMIAPMIISKTADPAVVVVDEKGDHVISLLSGHIGGANALARAVAGITRGCAVITTATDKNNLPSIDMIAKSLNLMIETPKNIKNVNAAFLENKIVKIFDDTSLLSGTIPKNRVSLSADPDEPDLDIFCSTAIHTVSRETLILRPRLLYVGIGCNRGTTQTQIRNFLNQIFKTHALSLNSIARICTSDIKKDEKGLVELAETLMTEVDYYTKDQLNSVTSIATPSDMVLKHLGVKSVCEASAILSSGLGRLIVTKQKNKDVTIAVAIKK